MICIDTKGGNAPTVLPKGFQPDRASISYMGQIPYRVNNGANKTLKTLHWWLSEGVGC